MTALRLAPLFIKAGQVGAPQLIEGQRAGAGVPQPHGLVRGAPVRQVLDDDAQQGAAQHGQVPVPVGEPSAVAVDEGMDTAPGSDADGAVQWRARQDERLIRLVVCFAGVVVAGDRDAVLAGRPCLPGQVTESP